MTYAEYMYRCSESNVHAHQCHHQAYDKHHSVSENRGINVYSFALNPEVLQPTGSANFNRIDDTSIEFNLQDASEVHLLSSSTIVYRVAVYALSINILRIFSGLGGLVFEQ